MATDQNDTTPNGFQLPKPVQFDAASEQTPEWKPAESSLASASAIKDIQLINLSDGEGILLFYPRRADNGMGTKLEVGDVLFLRERTEKPDEEDGVIIQIISLGTASYPHADTKALFRLMVGVRAATLNRSHNEPPETIDELLEAQFKVRACVSKGSWGPPEGRVVTRNVDIFDLNPAILAQHIFSRVEVARLLQIELDNLIADYPSEEGIIRDITTTKNINSHINQCFVAYKTLSEGVIKQLKGHSLDINLGDYKQEPVEFFGNGLEKINLITGMKGGGKSHIAKGIIAESLKAGMSAVVFDVNNEYNKLPNSRMYIPAENLKLRLDRIRPATFLSLIQRIAPFAERTEFVANAEVPRYITTARNSGRVPDIDWLISQAPNIFPGVATNEVVRNMRTSFTTTLEIVRNTGLIMSESEASDENKYMKDKAKIAQPSIVSLSSALSDLEDFSAGIIIFNIGGLLKNIQFAVVDMILDTLKDICNRQVTEFNTGKIQVPNYPTVYFEEAHMYMEPRVIDELLPLIRHFGMNVFFITNTPAALPDSVFRLIDNLIMTRILNKRDIDQVKNCGLTDANTIQGFASNLKEYHALLLSGQKGATKNFPLVFRVRDFKLPASGETRSMWDEIKKVATS